MATCSIKDPFVVDAKDFIRALNEAEKALEEEKKHPRPKVNGRKRTPSEIIRIYGG